MKTCSKCKVTYEDVSHNFYLRPSEPGKYVARCKRCVIEISKAAHQRQKDQHNQWQRNYRIANPGIYFEQRLRREYGITIKDYEKIWSQQKERCGLCKKGVPGKKGWSVDHDHQTGVVRGILCGNCNTGLGLFGDSEATLRAAIEYLNNHANLPQSVAKDQRLEVGLEQRLRCSKAKGGKPFTDERGNVYVSYRDASEKLGIDIRSIGRCLKGTGRKSVKGHTFSYLTQP